MGEACSSPRVLKQNGTSVHHAAGQPSRHSQSSAPDRSSSSPAEYGHLTAGEPRPVIDATVLRILEEHTGQSVAAKFFQDYLALLPVRTGGIVAGIAVEDRERALDNAVSLRVVSAMIGARQMEEYAGALERQLRLGQTPAVEATKRLLSKNILRILSESRHQGLLAAH
jgi:hypothetical protein